MKYLGLVLGLLCLGFVLGASSEKKENLVTLEKERAKADLYWDEWGVPHIFAESFESLSYAFGYAQARDHGRLLLQMMFLSSGKAAEERRIYSPVDRAIYSLRLHQATTEFFDIQHEESRIALENFAQGFNAFAEANPEFFSGDFATILPVTGIDVFRANLRVLYTFAFAGAAGLKGEFVEKYGEDPLRAQREKQEDVFYGAYATHDPFEHLDVPKELRHLIGSNAWAINSRSGKSDGKPKLNQNPHLPYLTFFRWYEAQLVCESCGIDVYGAGLVGIPNLQVAFNDYLGWTHTVNAVQPWTGYEIDLASENSYYYDGQILPITTEEVTYRVKQVIGYKTETVINEFTIHGQVIARAADKILVKRLAGFDDSLRPDAIKQWWDMGRAKTLTEFNAVMSQLQIPMFYTVVTTRDDDIMLNFNGWIPKRRSGTFQEWSKAVNGSTSDTWWDEVHPWSETPTIINPPSGFVQNANEPPWTATLPVFTLNPDDYPAYMAPEVGIAYRPQASIRLISTSYNITFDKLIELKHTCIKESASHTLDDLLKAVNDFGQSEVVFEAAEVLSNWDRLMDTTSRGSDLYEAWIRRSPPTAELYVNPWDPSDPLATPNTLADPQLAVVDLELAANSLLARGMALDSQYGDNNKLPYGPFDPSQFLPGNGCSDCFRSSYFFGGVTFGGDSWVSIIEWDENGAHAKALIGYGNASPGSAAAPKHVHDQNTLFSNKELRDVWRTQGEILQHLEEYVELFV